MTFQRKFAVIGILVVVGFATMFWTGQNIISKVMVNGPIYNLLARDKDLISDVLPPNEFIVEPYLVVCQINGAQSPAALKKYSRELQDLETKFRDSHAAWSQKLSLNAPGLEGVLARELLQNAYRSADSFFKVVHGGWKNAIENEDYSTANKITIEQLNPLYEAHREAILKAVETAQELVVAHEKDSQEAVDQGMFRGILVSAVVLLVVLIVGAFMMRSVYQVASMMGGVKRATDSLAGTAVEMYATSKQQETTVHHFGASTTQIAAAVREITVTGSELMNTMVEVEGVAKNSAALASTSRTGLADMKSVMQNLAHQSVSISEKLEQINVKTKDISGVVVTITKVADQTNLLSVNAALEAEKAGEHGRGFLVVAREIRRLADQTAAATLDIEHTVTHMQSAVSAGVMEMDKFSSQVNNSVVQVETIGSTLTNIIESVEVMKNQFGSVSQGMNSQNLGAKQIGEAMGNLSDNVKVTIQSLGEFSNAADQMKNSVGALNKELVRFNL
jgi:methyl-accepting chemotaxis protein WspA